MKGNSYSPALMREIDRHIRQRTGFEAGSMSVTCPAISCGAEVRGKFCPRCGREVVTLNYEMLQGAIQSGRLSPEELLNLMNEAPGFNQKSKNAQRLFDRIQEENAVLREDD